MKAIVAYFAAGLVMFVLDAIWLSSMGAVYRQHLGSMLLDGFRPVPAALFYLMYVAGIVVLAVMPALREGDDWRMAALYGAVLGFIAYGTYDLTNYATMKVWSRKDYDHRHALGRSVDGAFVNRRLPGGAALSFLGRGWGPRKEYRCPRLVGSERMAARFLHVRFQRRHTRDVKQKVVHQRR